MKYKINSVLGNMFLFIFSLRCMFIVDGERIII
jgi:hypothetical protein